MRSHSIQHAAEETSTQESYDHPQNTTRKDKLYRLNDDQTY